MLEKKNLQDLYPLSPMQEGLLFHALHGGDRGDYLLQLRFRLAGSLDRGRVERVMAALFERHDVLRTVFVHRKVRRPLQAVLKERRPEVACHDLADLPEGDREEEAERRRREDRERPFDLGRDPLMRLSILRHGSDRFEIVWTYHHIVLDGWSMGILVREFVELYAADAAGRAPRLLPATPYGTYVEWLQRRPAELSRRYWSGVLEGYRHPVSLLDGASGGGHEAPAGGRHETFAFELGRDRADRLRELAAARRWTIGSVFQTLWGVLLQRWTDRADVVFGTIVAGRPADIRRSDEMVGLFINAVPVRVNGEARTTFAELVAEAQAAAIGSEPHQHYPLADLQADAGLPGALFDHLVLFENYPLDESVTEGLSAAETGFEIEAVEGSQQTHYGLTVMAFPTPGLEVKVSYDPGLYGSVTLARLERRLLRLADAVLEDPERPMARLDLRSAAERHRAEQELAAPPLAIRWRGDLPEEIAAVLTAPALPPGMEAVAGLLAAWRRGVRPVWKAEVRPLAGAAAPAEAGPRELAYRTRSGAAVGWEVLLGLGRWAREALELGPGTILEVAADAPATEALALVLETLRLGGGARLATAAGAPATHYLAPAGREPEASGDGAALCWLIQVGPADGAAPPRLRDRFPALRGVAWIDGRPDGGYLARSSPVTGATGEEPGLLGHPVPGTRVRVVDRLGVPRPSGSGGEIALSTAVPDGDGREPLPLGERGYMDDAGGLRSLGPSPGVLRLAGRRVPLTDLARLLRDSLPPGDRPSELEIVTFPEVGSEGAEPVAFYALADPGAPPSDLTRRWSERVEAELPGFAARLRWHRLDRVPRDPAGRPDREVLAGHAQLVRQVVPRIERWLHRRRPDGGWAVVPSLDPPAAEAVHRDDVLPELAALPASPPPERSEGTAGADGAGPAAGPPALLRGGPISPPEGLPDRVPDLLLRAAAEGGDRGVVVVGTRGTARLSYRELARRARTVASGLQASGLTPGARVLLLQGEVEEYLVTLWGAWLAGLIPATVAAPRAWGTDDPRVEKLLGAWEALGRPDVVVGGEAAERLGELATRPGWSGLSVRLPRRGPEAGKAAPLPAATDPVAFFQLTSGSTGTPKVIPIHHRAVLLHLVSLARAARYEPGDEVTLNWLPFDHVVPLLTFHLRDVFFAAPQVQVATEKVLDDPLSWLDLLESHQVTRSWAPNFGFELVLEAAAREPGRTWDLSRLRALMNAGESVAPSTLERFEAELAGHGLHPAAIQPAYGMAELATCVTYARPGTDGEASYRVLRVPRQAPGAGAGGGDAATAPARLADSGQAVPGIEIRVVGPEGQTVPEGRIGAIQARGELMFGGYLNAPEEATFTADGWFRTGDRGLVADGRLFVTGRELERLVVRGVNFSASEVERVAARAPGVDPTRVAACGVTGPGPAGDELALFFTPRVEGDRALAALAAEIEERVSRELGISPELLVPVPEEAFPRTTSGKVQRRRLLEELAAGTFADASRGLDLLLGRRRVVPAWFFEPVWRRSEPEARLSLDPGVYLVLGLGGESERRLAERLRTAGAPCLQVLPGQGFRRIDPDRLVMDPRQAGAWDLLGAAVAEGWPSVAGVVQLAEGRAGAESGGGDPRPAVLDLLHLLQALRRVDRLPRRLVSVTRDAARVVAGEGSGYAGAALAAFGRSAAREAPGAAFLHVDLPAAGAGPAATADLLLMELRTDDGEDAVAWRGGRRLVPRLRPLAPAAAAERELPFRPGGLYLLAGGLGGIGRRIAETLTGPLGAKVLLLGRRPTDGATPGAADAVRVEAADVRDERAVAAAVERAERWAGRRLDGIVHLAGEPHRASLWDETAEGVERALGARVEGTRVLRRLAREWTREREGLAVWGVASLDAELGGAGHAAYAAAHGYLGACLAHGVACGEIGGGVVAFGRWRGVGMARRLEPVDLAASRGIRSLSAADGVASFLVGARLARPFVHVGLAPRHPEIRRRLDPGTGLRQRLSVVLEAPDADLELETRLSTTFAGTALRHGFELQVESRPSLPRRGDGSVDLWALRGTEGDARRSSAPVAPRNETEAALVAIWEEVLGVSGIGVHDNFFQLGGQSIRAIQVFSRMAPRWGELPFHALERHPTVASFADNVLARQTPAVSSGEILVPLNEPEPECPDLFLVHAANCEVMTFRELGRIFEGEINLVGLQARGLFSPGTPLPESFSELIESYVHEVERHRPEGDLYLLGYSLSVHLVFEMTRLLERRGRRVARMLLVDNPPDDKVTSDAEIRHKTAFLVRAALERILGIRVEPGLELEEEELVRHVYERFGGPEGTIRHVPREPFLRYVEVVRNVFRCVKDYRLDPAAAVDAETVYFAPEAERGPSTMRGWERHVRGRWRVDHLPGEHTTFFMPPHLGTSAERVRRHLSAVPVVSASGDRPLSPP